MCTKRFEILEFEILQVGKLKVWMRIWGIENLKGGNVKFENARSWKFNLLFGNCRVHRFFVKFCEDGIGISYPSKTMKSPAPPNIPTPTPAPDRNLCVFGPH